MGCWNSNFTIETQNDSSKNNAQDERADRLHLRGVIQIEIFQILKNWNFDIIWKIGFSLFLVARLDEKRNGVRRGLKRIFYEIWNFIQ